MARKKTTGFFFKMSPEESALFEKRMAMAGKKNKSAFIRKMCIDGHVINLELSTLNEIKRLLSINSNNINQIAKRANSGGEVRREDIAELTESQTEILMRFGKLLTILSDISSAKPGKRFMPPLTIRDLPEYNQQPTDLKGE